MSSSTADAAELPAAAIAESAAEPTSRRDLDRSLVLWLTNVSHALIHFQNQMQALLYPIIMAELGFGPAQLGVLAAVQNVFSSAAQAGFGFLTPFFMRTRLLGAANLVVSLGTFLTGFVPSYSALLGTRAIMAAGSSAQHPVGASLLSGFFPRNRGTILALNSSLANVGALLAPISVSLLLLVVGWRQIFIIVAIATLVMGVAYFFFRDRAGARRANAASRKARLAEGRASYARVLRNRNMMVISLIMMVGAAGRDGGVNQTFLGPHLVDDLGLSVAIAAVALSVLQVGSIVGPLGFGWLSDRLSRRWVMQASLLLSALATWWFARQDAYLPVLLVNLLFYGMVSYSRGTLTQALIADSLTDTDRDAAFSVYYTLGLISGPIWSLVTGFLMQSSGFSTAFTVLGFSYLTGMLLLFLIEDPRAKKPAAAVA